MMKIAGHIHMFKKNIFPISDEIFFSDKLSPYITVVQKVPRIARIAQRSPKPRY
jgi:hypothetical protein